MDAEELQRLWRLATSLDEDSLMAVKAGLILELLCRLESTEDTSDMLRAELEKTRKDER